MRSAGAAQALPGTSVSFRPNSSAGPAGWIAVVITDPGKLRMRAVFDDLALLATGNGAAGVRTALGWRR
jgi:hypothetical protein